MGLRALLWRRFCYNKGMDNSSSDLLRSLEDPLYTYSDAEAFWARESPLLKALAEAENSHPRQKVAVWKALHSHQTEQAAWLRIEQVFEQEPELDSLVVSRDEEEDGFDGYLFVELSTADEVYGLGAHPEGLDEKLQEFLNDMGRNQFGEFHGRLVELGEIQRDALFGCASEVLGGEWASERSALRLESSFPAGVDQDKRAKPRF